MRDARQHELKKPPRHYPFETRIKSSEITSRLNYLGQH